jgi:hypothetical protein
MAAKTGTYTLIASTTINTPTATISFTSIPSTYTDLILIVGSLLQVNSGNGVRIRFNNDTGTNYSVTQILGNGTSVTSARESNSSSGYAGGATYSNTNPGTAIAHIMDYANTNTYKTILNRGSQAGSDVVLQAGLWRSTAAINGITLAMGGGFPSNNIASGTFKLYGIEAGNL